MNTARVRGTEVARFALELLLVSFAAWLVIQNTLLLAFDPWSTRPAALVAIAALLKAAGHVLVALWPYELFALAACAGITAGLVARIASRRRNGGLA